MAGMVQAPSGEWYYPRQEQPRPREVTAAEERELINRALQLLVEAAVKKGALLEEAQKRAQQYRDRFRVVSRLGGPEVQAYNAGVWTGSFVDTVRAMGFDLARAIRVAAHGPDPADLLRDMLIAGGVVTPRAVELSRHRAWREEDGGIAVKYGSGEVRHGELWLKSAAQELLDAERNAARAAELRREISEREDPLVSYRL